MMRRTDGLQALGSFEDQKLLPNINRSVLLSSPSDFRADRQWISVLERRATAVATLLLVLHVAVSWMARQPGVLLGHNDAMYVSLGESLRKLEYREIWYVGTPPHAMYPPVYPAVLALLETIHGNSFHWLVWSNLLASAAALALLFAAVRTWYGPLPALACLAALAVNPLIVTYAGSLAAETHMILAIAVVVWALAHEDRGTNMTVVAAIAALIAALLRTAAIPLVAAVTLHWLLQRRYRRAMIYSAAAIGVIGSWLLWSAVVPDQSPGRSYVADAMLLASRPSIVGELARRITGHVARYASIAYWNLPMPTVSGWRIDNVIGFPLAFAALVAGAVAVARTWTATALFLGFYGALIAVWPYIEDRFLVPVLPLLVICTVIGSVRLVRLGFRVPAVIGCTVVLLMIATGTVSVTAAAARGLACDRSGFFPDPACMTPAQRGVFEAMRYIRDNTPPEAVFLSSKPATLYYYTGRRSVIRELAARSRPDSFLTLLKTRGARYLLLGSTDYMDMNRFAPRIRATCRSLDLERRVQAGVYLFRVRDESVPSDGRACDAIEDYYREMDSRRQPKS